MTQWCFGAPLFDRVFLMTGGSCLIGPSSVPAASMRACRSAGGSWSGGHDISGHCFLLLHSTLFLVEEVIRPLPRANRSLHRTVVGVASVSLVAVWVVMLHFTAKFFHGPLELISGSVLGIAFWAAMYYRRPSTVDHLPE
ncbi:hypothetical protein DL89DRAFT_219831 [Linderina pennispora]|uniref:Phosphatidic acid phosphatase type 2/haloperoxidase domain-containing protein n=1 Tax=Linderina pennispora TaxID=61395 RepID=A0A1Y1WKG4_9FUNG|nr:uncharacterized protein DL89DRAFT_219831 [Linderina pennispora]ORX73584.1 hypothetical protein DL89DRAFT_219831 [Linderina pennispora]